MTRELWREGTFEVATQEGRVAVNGLVSNDFGVRDAGRRRPIWTVTHLPTGELVTPRTAGFSNLDMAITFADRIASLPGWSSVADGTPNDELGYRVVTIWNELIALDMANTIVSHYGAAASGAPLKRKPSRSKRRV